MNKTVIEFVESVFRPTVTECEKYRYIVRGTEFQKEADKKLSELKNQIAELKTSMIQLQDEDSANCLLSLEMIASALQHELRLWIAIKEDRMGDAWDELVDARSFTDAAISAHKISNYMVSNLKRLQVIERLLFPKVIFMSPGLTFRSSRCSICGSEYGTCDHLKGLPYMGEFCAQELLDISIREISIVSDPADRHARLSEMEVDGIIRDLLTWREITSNPHEDAPNLAK